MLLYVITINTNAWSDTGHVVTQIYDILYMIGRDDVAIDMGVRVEYSMMVEYSRMLVDIFL